MANYRSTPPTDTSFDVSTPRMNDQKVSPNMLDMAPTMMTRNANNNAPELMTFVKPTAKPVTYENPFNADNTVGY